MMSSMRSPHARQTLSACAQTGMTKIHRRMPQKRNLFVVLLFPVVALLILVVLSMSSSSSTKSSVLQQQEQDGVGRIYTHLDDLPTTTKFDAILVLGGGVPRSVNEPPIFVQKRCDDAAAVVRRQQQQQQQEEPLVPILSLSAGTTHRPQFMSPRGQPVWESTASSAYLVSQHNFHDNLYVETTSFDTIGNAYFARTSHTDIAGWRTLLVITNQFHIERTKAIFDWVYGVENDDDAPYRLYYLASENVGLSDEAIAARTAHEAKGATRVRTQLAPQHPTLRSIWHFLTHDHDLYTATKLVEGAHQIPANDPNLQDSYGA